MYSYKKGLAKAAGSAVSAIIFLAVLTGASELDLWTLAEKYLKPILAGVSVVAVLRFAQNWLKMQVR